MARAPKPGGDYPRINTTAPDVWVRLADQRWPYRAGDTTARQARQVRETTGLSRSHWITDVIETRGTEVDSWAVLCWLARMQNGEPNLTLDEVEDGLRYGADFAIEPGVVDGQVDEVEGDEDGADLPETYGAG